VSGTKAPGWLAIEAEVLRRIHSRDWPPGSAIPNEADLAADFGVARATVNRALQSLAESGILDRRRKAGTRVALHPVRKATLNIPILRHEIEAQGMVHGYTLVSQQESAAPPQVTSALRLPDGTSLMHLRALHLADNRPYAYEDRWLNTAAVPGIAEVDLSLINANEWLVANAPFTAGDFALSATSADATEAAALGTPVGTALLTLERTTWNGGEPITWVMLCFAPGHRMRTEL